MCILQMLVIALKALLCLAGKERLWEARKTFTHEFLMHFKPAQGCSFLAVKRISLVEYTWKDTETLRQNPHWHPLEEYKDWSTFPFQLCTKCLSAMKVRHKEGREKVWEMLFNDIRVRNLHTGKFSHLVAPKIIVVIHERSCLFYIDAKCIST
jgi:hypothetical protein